MTDVENTGDTVFLPSIIPEGIDEPNKWGIQGTADAYKCMIVPVSGGYNITGARHASCSYALQDYIYRHVDKKLKLKAFLDKRTGGPFSVLVPHLSGCKIPHASAIHSWGEQRGCKIVMNTEDDKTTWLITSDKDDKTCLVRDFLFYIRKYTNEPGSGFEYFAASAEDGRRMFERVGNTTIDDLLCVLRSTKYLNEITGCDDADEHSEEDADEHTEEDADEYTEEDLDDLRLKDAEMIAREDEEYEEGLKREAERVKREAERVREVAEHIEEIVRSCCD